MFAMPRKIRWNGNEAKPVVVNLRQQPASSTKGLSVAYSGVSEFAAAGCS